jgi:hypothetical protein
MRVTLSKTISASTTNVALCVLSVTSLLFLSGCVQPTPEKPRPAVAKEAVKSLCNNWLASLPTWVDEDTEATKDEIDYSYRVHDAACAAALTTSGD